MSSFTLERNRQSELMDQPGLDAGLHCQALRALRRVNWLCGTGGQLWRSMRDLARAAGDRPLRVLDVASGGGDVAIALARRARRAGLRLEVHGCDISPTAIEFANRAAADAGIREARFFHHDVLRDALAESYDVVTCTLFLHHLDEPDAELALARMAQAARRLVLVDDLRRSRTGYWLAWLACRALTRSTIVHVDGPRSVEGAFTSGEAVELARRAGLEPVDVRHHWPERFLLRWRRPE